MTLSHYQAAEAVACPSCSVPALAPCVRYDGTVKSRPCEPRCRVAEGVEPRPADQYPMGVRKGMGT